MAGASWADFFGDPSFRNLEWAVFDTTATLPGLPSSAYIRKGGKRLFKVAKLKKYAKTSKGKAAIKKALKPVNAKVSKATSELAKISRLAKNYKLTNNTYVKHILERHGPRSTWRNKSKFVEGFNIKDGIRSTLTSDSVIKNNTNSREGYIFIKNFNRTIGYDGKKPLKNLKVVLSKDGYVTTAYPMK